MRQKVEVVVNIKRDLPALRTLIENNPLTEAKGSGTSKSMSDIEQAKKLLDQALGMALKNPNEAYKLAQKASRITAQTVPYEGENQEVNEAAYQLTRALRAYINYHTKMSDYKW